VDESEWNPHGAKTLQLEKLLLFDSSTNFALLRPSRSFVYILVKLASILFRIIESKMEKGGENKSAPKATPCTEPSLSGGLYTP